LGNKCFSPGQGMASFQNLSLSHFGHGEAKSHSISHLCLYGSMDKRLSILVEVVQITRVLSNTVRVEAKTRIIERPICSQSDDMLLVVCMYSTTS